MRGVRQGCPLSLLLFNIAIETLAIAVRSSKEIEGIHILSTEHKLASYADNVVFFLINPLFSVFII